jgi:choline kinase
VPDRVQRPHLLDRQLDALAANGVEEAVVVTGFRDDQIEAALKRRGDAGPTVRTVYNPFYKVADNLGSLFVAKEEIDGDVLVWNGDTLVSETLMARVVGNRTRTASASPSTARTAMTRMT